MRDNLPTADELLMGGGGQSAAFPVIGHTVSGTIMAAPKVQQQIDLDTGEPKTFPNGDPMLQIVVQLQTEIREDSEDDGVRNLYIKNKMLNAVREAIKEAGATSLSQGGVLAVVYIGDEAPKKRGYSGAKLYAASYQPPPSPADKLLGATSPGAGAQTAGRPAYTPAPATPPPPPVAHQGNGGGNGLGQSDTMAQVRAMLDRARAEAAAAQAAQAAQQPALPAPTGVDPAVWAQLTPEQQRMALGGVDTPPF